MGIAYGVMDLKANAGRMVLAVAAVVVVLTGVLGLWSVRRLEPEGPTRADGEAVSAFLEQQHGKHVAVSFDLYYHSLRFANADSVKEMADRCEERLWNGRSVENYLASYGFPPTMAAAFTRNFTEKEQAYVARGRLISAFPAGDVQLEYFANSAKDASVPRFGLKTVDEEFAAISDGKLDAVLILENDEWIGGPTGKSLGGRVYVVTRDSGPTGAATMKR